MKLAYSIGLGLVGGLVGGLLLSELIGIIGYLIFQKPVGIKYLPIFCAIACAAAAPILMRRKLK